MESKGAEPPAALPTPGGGLVPRTPRRFPGLTPFPSRRLSRYRWAT